VKLNLFPAALCPNQKESEEANKILALSRKGYDNHQRLRHTFLQWRSRAALAAIQAALSVRLAIQQAEMSTILRTGRHKMGTG
jgi:hypothetical protein